MRTSKRKILLSPGARAVAPAALLVSLADRDVGGADDVAVALLLLLQEDRHLLGRHRGGLEAEREHALAHLRILDRLADFRSEPVGDLFRRAGRGGIADPRADV